MINGFKPIPDLPIEIKEAVNNGTLAVFIGAGVSRLVGCEGWDELAKKLVERCYKDKYFNFREKEALSRITDQKKTITICYNVFKSSNNEDIFFEEMNKSLKEMYVSKSAFKEIEDELELETGIIRDELRKKFILDHTNIINREIDLADSEVYSKIDSKFEDYKKNIESILRGIHKRNYIGTPNIYNEIVDLGALCITTNADTHFDRLFHPKNIIIDPKDFLPGRLDKKNLYHIHGSVHDRANLIFTVSKYLERYSEDSFRAFLNEIFDYDKYTVLFLGYGLAEFEILDFILRYKNKQEGLKLAPKHFMLSPVYQGEENIMKYEKEYYNDLGINIKMYEKDDKGYNYLIDVLRSWKKEIRQTTKLLHNGFSEIDEAVV